jgi:hippurate hydrolase
MDALEMPEDTGLEFASAVDGKMHACGHDVHVAMLIGAARLLASHRADLRGRVVLMFQPGEEGYGGARVMLSENLLSAYGQVDRAFALHIISVLPSGLVACRPGPMLACSDEFQIKVIGRGGHASMPQDATDPVPVACEIVTAVQVMVTRVVPAFDPAVVTVARIAAGTAFNVIPESVTCAGTIRAVSDASRERAIAGLRQVAEHVAAAHGCWAEVDVIGDKHIPVTVNDAGAVDRTLAVAQSLIGSERVVSMPTPVMAMDDWSYVLQQVPGSMAFLGAAPPGVARPAPNHSNRMVLDETVIATGIALNAAMALS